MTDIIDPALVPKVTLATGDKMPIIGMGTFGSDHADPELVASCVGIALELGYRLFDCASVYGNEDLIGVELERALKNGVAERSELFVMSKVWNDSHKRVVESCKKSLHDLRLDYLDAYFIHWPFPNWHAPHCDINSRSPDARPYIHEEFMETWAQMETLVKEGLVRNPGISNVTIPKLKLILRDAKIKPVLNEMELHPSFQQPELYKYTVENGMQPVGYCPVGSPNRPARDMAPDDVVDTAMPVIVEIAKAHNVHPAVVCLKWSAQRGTVPIPFSTKRANLASNLRAVTEDPLTDEEMAAIAASDKNCRFIKGHVFLWEGAEDWYDLWDVDGVIPGWKK